MSSPGRNVLKFGLGEIEINLLTHSQNQRALSELILPALDQGFANIAPLPCNVKAVEAGLLFATGHSKFVLLTGPSGHGKTTIARAAESYLMSQRDKSSDLVPADYFLKSKFHTGSNDPLIVDDCQMLLQRSKQRLMFRLALERRVRSGSPTLLVFGASGIDNSITSLLPNPRIWNKANITEPTRQERELLIRHLAKAENLTLSPCLIDIMAGNIFGSGRVFQGSLRRLKLEQSEWLGPQNILKACGILDPYFVDNSGWDLRHRIWNCAKEFCLKESGIDPKELACYTMLKTAHLCEDSVSRYFQENPTACYMSSQKFVKTKRADANTSGLHLVFVSQIVARLLQ